MKNKKIIFTMFIASLFLILSACKSSDKNESSFQETIIYESEDSREQEHFLLNATSHLSDSRGNMGGKKVSGQSEEINLSKKEFETITDEEFAEFVNSREGKSDYDWVAIVFDDGTAILFLNTYDFATYGVWDPESGISKPLGIYERTQVGYYEYTNVSTDEK